MHLSIVFILFISIHTISASPLPIASSIDNIPAISKREDVVPIATDALLEAWRTREASFTTGSNLGRVHKSTYLNKPVLIKGYVLKSGSTNQLEKRAKIDVKIHEALGDFITWGKVSNLMGDIPHYMIVIRGDGNYISASSAIGKLGSMEGVKALESTVIDDISKKADIKRDHFKNTLMGFVFYLGPDAQWKALYV